MQSLKPSIGPVRAWLAGLLVAACSAGCSTSGEPPANDGVDTNTSANDTRDVAADDASVDTESATDTAEVGDTANPADTSAPSDIAADTTPTDAVDDVDDGGPWSIDACTAVALEDSIPLPEASGAALLDPTRALVVSDSGNNGVAVIFDMATETTVPTELPLGTGAGDDVEGLSVAPDGRVWGITSAGWLRVWQPSSTDTSFSLVGGPIAVASLESPWACDAQLVNCGPNYEGLCLHPAPVAGECSGYLASKAYGQLACLVERADGAGYEVDSSRLIDVAPNDQLSGCTFEPVAPYRLFVAGNVFSPSRIWWVDTDETVVPFALVGAGNQEALLATESGLWSFGDVQGILGDQSPVTRIDCRP